MFTRSPVGKLVAVRKKDMPALDEFRLDFRDLKGFEHKQVTLESILPHIKPHTYLARTTTDDNSSQYRIEELTKATHNFTTKDWLKRMRGLDRGRQFHISTVENSSRLGLLLARIYIYLLEGARIHIGLHENQGIKKKKVDMDTALRDRPDLQPETILRSMPEGTEILAHPCTIDAGAEISKSSVHWSLEHAPSLREKGSKTPEWMKKMATWHVPLELDPEQPKTQETWTMYTYSKAQQAKIDNI